jgi:hypothetical protein
MEREGTALYLYCFAPSNFLGGLEGTGVDGVHPLSVFRRFPNPCAILSAVRVEEFCGEAAEVRRRDAAWLGERVRRHEAVVEEVMRRSTVLPVRFGTLFSSYAQLTEFLQEQRAVISDFLERVAGHEEWTVRGLLDRRQAGDALTAAGPSPSPEPLSAPPASGPAAPEELFGAPAPCRIQFAELPAPTRQERALKRWIEETRWQATRDLMAQASDYCECPSAPAEFGPSGIEVVLNWAYLLPRTATAAFRERIEQLNSQHAPRGLVFHMSGPLPPYRFVPPLAMGGEPGSEPRPGARLLDREAM